MRRIEKGQTVKLIIAFILATVLLSMVFITIDSVSYLDYMNSQQQTNAILKVISYMESQGQNASCDNDFVANTSQKLDFVAKSMTLLETQWGTDDPRVLAEKKLYSQLEVNHLNIVLELNKKCDGNFLPVLFFYSNQPNLKERSQGMGFILDSFRQTNLGRVMVYSFDYNLNSSAIEQLKKEYNITSAPSIAIGKNFTVFTPDNINELYPYLNQ